ncbi:hypothetical protein TKWG_07815 [Advenella kashmirensis WT001]|uniref:Uncharacterized protein n=1 Tax=Advenella kashmirensis (strain DSM 17095 / LMG 22695 / WT001) TaxID=1036672 RepID=I3UAD6_ADVKW|nr:hypothetical protein TKWG_07815 [Advenella kashmirensis WT001]
MSVPSRRLQTFAIGRNSREDQIYRDALSRIKHAAGPDHDFTKSDVAEFFLQTHVSAVTIVIDPPPATACNQAFAASQSTWP